MPRPASQMLARLPAMSWLLLLLLAALEAHAGFGTCSNPTYLQRFDARLRDYDCVTRNQRTLATPEGTRRLRIIHHRGAALDPAALAQVQRGLDAGIAALGRIGRYAIYDTSILVAHDVPAPGDTLAATEAIARDGSATHECQIVFYARDVSITDTAPTIAHELFHCLQAGTFSPGQNKSYRERRGGAWWIEGSAEWFASLALPDPSIYQARADDFAVSIQRNPLYRHEYDSLVFFLWLAQREGTARVLPFLAGMPQEPSDAVQRQALRDALSDAQWMRFAIDLSDQAIRRPHGPPLNVYLPTKAQWTWDRDRTDQLAIRPYTITKAASTLSCGVWETQVAPARMYVSRPLRAGGWGALPARIDTSDGDARYLHVATHTGDGEVQHRFRVQQSSGCTRCGDTTRIDACLVGTWRETAGGSLPWLRDNMPAAAHFRAQRGGTPELRLQRDGLYITDRVSASASMQPGTSTSRWEGDAQMQSSGRWSAADGRLNICTDLQSLGGEVRAIHRNQTVRINLPALPPAQSTMSYTCHGNTLQTEQAMPKPGGGQYPPMRTTYTRTR